ncbi:hypothetical protein M0R45_030563 [Rubus argutus]|uniref:Uncharacterized protein n=1 Tax=Rubus argutus TaxID=59490 RepID=A0AAW1WFK0_RUBAR
MSGDRAVTAGLGFERLGTTAGSVTSVAMRRLPWLGSIGDCRRGKAHGFDDCGDCHGELEMMNCDGEDCDCRSLMLVD